MLAGAKSLEIPGNIAESVGGMRVEAAATPVFWVSAVKKEYYVRRSCSAEKSGNRDRRDLNLKSSLVVTENETKMLNFGRMCAIM